MKAGIIVAAGTPAAAAPRNCAGTGKSDGTLIEHTKFDYIGASWSPGMPGKFSTRTGENCTYVNSANYRLRA